MRITVKGLSAATALITALSFAPISAHACMLDGGYNQGGMHHKKIAAELGLSAQQKHDIKGIIANHKPQIQPLRKELVAERRALRTLIQSETFDEAAIRAQSAKVATTEADMAVERAKMAQQIRAVLTPEQIQKYLAMQAKRDHKIDTFQKSPRRGDWSN